MRERTFQRDGRTVTTMTPAVATQLVAEGWEEVELPEGRPEPEQAETAMNLGVADGKVQSRTEYGQESGGTGIPTVDQDDRIPTGARRARRAEPPAGS